MSASVILVAGHVVRKLNSNVIVTRHCPYNEWNGHWHKEMHALCYLCIQRYHYIDIATLIRH